MIEKSSQQQRREKNPFANLGKKVHERKENPHPLDPNANRPFVHRSLRWPERVPLTQIVPGQKFRGLIISVRGYGLYLDIGAQMDGLVHISDASDKYFLYSLSDRYVAGQEVDCWVKECFPSENKLHLQLYPYHRKESNISFEWDNCTVGSAISGVVVKFSDYGAYVDVGAPVLAFIHRHKMKSNRRQRKLESWEIYPLGTKLTDAWVYQVDPTRKRIEITTYPQDVWDWRFPRPHEKIIRRSRGNDDDEYNDDELNSEENRETDFENPDGIGYSERKFAAMFGNLEKELSEKDHADEESEILSSEEVHRLTGKRLLIDDLAADSENEENPPTSYQTMKKNTNRQKRQIDREIINEDNEISTSELYEELTNGHGYLTLTHLKKWSYIQTFLEENYVTNDQLRRMFRDAGGFRGRLSEEEFEQFLQLFQQEMGLRDIDDFDEDGNLIVDPSSTELTNDQEDRADDDDDEGEDEDVEDSIADTVESDLQYFGQNFESFFQQQQQLDSHGTATTINTPVTSTVKVIQPQRSSMSMYENILTTSFDDLRKRSEGVKWNDILRWTLVKSMLKDKVLEVTEAKTIFDQIVQGKTMMNYLQFKAFAEELKALDLGRSASLSSESTPIEPSDNLDKKIPIKAKKLRIFKPSSTPKSSSHFQTPSTSPTSSPSFAPTAPSDAVTSTISAEDRTDVDVEEEYEDDESFFLRVANEAESKSEAELVKSMFQEFSNNQSYIKPIALLEWDLVSNLIGAGILTEESFLEKVKQMSEGKPGLDFEGFDQLLTDVLVMYDQPDENDEGKAISSIESQSSPIAQDTFNGFDPRRQQSNSTNTEDEESDSFELNIDECFETLSKGKTFVTPQAIREWDFIKDLLEAGALTEVDLNRTLVSIQPKKKNQFTFADFALCMDELLILAGFDVEGYEDREFSDYDDKEEGEEEESEGSDQSLLPTIDINELIGSSEFVSENR